jgi:hypothetical protein
LESISKKMNREGLKFLQVKIKMKSLLKILSANLLFTSNYITLYIFLLFYLNSFLFCISSIFLSVHFFFFFCLSFFPFFCFFFLFFFFFPFVSILLQHHGFNFFLFIIIIFFHLIATPQFHLCKAIKPTKPTSHPPICKAIKPLDRHCTCKSPMISTSNPQNICKSTMISPSNQ